MAAESSSWEMPPLASLSNSLSRASMSISLLSESSPDDSALVSSSLLMLPSPSLSMDLNRSSWNFAAPWDAPVLPLCVAVLLAVWVRASELV